MIDRLVNYNWLFVIAGLMLFWAGTTLEFNFNNEALIVPSIIIVAAGLYLANKK